MWFSLFTVILAVAIGLGFGAIILESGQKNSRRYARRRVVRARS